MWYTLLGIYAQRTIGDIALRWLSRTKPFLSSVCFIRFFFRKGSLQQTADSSQLLSSSLSVTETVRMGYFAQWAMMKLWQAGGALSSCMQKSFSGLSICLKSPSRGKSLIAGLHSQAVPPPEPACCWLQQGLMCVYKNHCKIYPFQKPGWNHH